MEGRKEENFVKVKVKEIIKLNYHCFKNYLWDSTIYYYLLKSHKDALSTLQTINQYTTLSLMFCATLDFAIYVAYQDKGYYLWVSCFQVMTSLLGLWTFHKQFTSLLPLFLYTLFLLIRQVIFGISLLLVVIYYYPISLLISSAIQFLIGLAYLELAYLYYRRVSRDKLKANRNNNNTGPMIVNSNDVFDYEPVSVNRMGDVSNEIELEEVAI